MANRLGMVGEERLRTRRLLVQLGLDLREARLALGVKQADAARAAGVARSTLGRIERGEFLTVPLEDFAAVAAAVGRRLSPTLHPSGTRLRDGRQAGMINRYLEIVAPGAWQGRTEVLVGRVGDQRSIDLVLSRPSVRIAHEFISRFRDAQAHARSLLVKASDAGIGRLILVIAGTSTNREALREAGASLRASFPLGTRAVLTAIREGRDPGNNGIVFL